MTINKHNYHPMRRLKEIFAGGLTAAFIIISPSSIARGTTPAGPSSSHYVKGSLCTQPDQIVFSCPLAKNGKIVSVCAAGNSSPHTFYYAFGTPHAIEMRYPSVPSTSSSGFSHAFLGYTGGTGGYAYSFVKDGFKYIIYSIQGKFRFEKNGVMVQKPGSLFSLSDMECRKGELISTSSVMDETLKWKKDDDIDGEVLPTPK